MIRVQSPGQGTLKELCRNLWPFVPSSAESRLGIAHALMASDVDGDNEFEDPALLDDQMWLE